jgi:hypothetical protein
MPKAIVQNKAEHRAARNQPELTAPIGSPSGRWVTTSLGMPLF